MLETVRRAEELGFDDVWFPDSQLLWRDVFTTLTAAALGTGRIGLGTAVTNLATRHPAVVALGRAQRGRTGTRQIHTRPRRGQQLGGARRTAPDHLGGDA